MVSTAVEVGPGGSAMRALWVLRPLVRSAVKGGSGPARAIALLATTFGLFAGALTAEAQAQSEVLAGTARTTTGSWYCYGGGVGQTRNVWVSFNVSGTATGPYPWPFTETGTASLHGNYGPFGSGSLNISFKIASDTTTITGTSTKTNLYGGVYCGGSIGFNTSSATYTATIQAPGENPQMITGAAAVAGSLYTAPNSQDSLTATLTLP
jgi:hypothetical protein